MQGFSCNFENCQVKNDFLPFTCQYCEQRFCSEHRSRPNHFCINSNNSKNSESVFKGSSYTTYNDLVNSAVNRFENETKTNGDSKTHINVRTVENSASADISNSSLAKKVEKLRQFENDNATEKTKNIANKTKQILIAKDAKGNPNIEVSSRFYVVFHFTDNNIDKFPSVNLFFSNMSLIGEILQYVTTNYTAISFGATDKPSNKSLVLYTESCPDWRLYDLQAVVKDVLTPFEDVFITSIDTVEVTENQSRLQQQRHRNQQASVETYELEKIVSKPFVVGDEVIYTKSTGEDEPARVVDVHRDDFPNVYYTILMYNTTNSERQTTANRLRAAVNSSVSTTGVKHVTIAPPQHEKTFPIRIIYGSQIHNIEGIFQSMLVTQLKSHILAILNITAKLSTVKLICKGKVLKDKGRGCV